METGNGQLTDEEHLTALREEWPLSRTAIMKRRRVGSHRAARLLGVLEAENRPVVPDHPDQTDVVEETIDDAVRPVVPDQVGTKRQRTGRTVRGLLVLVSLPAAISIWSGWVGLGQMVGFGPVHPLPGIMDGFEINSAITLPVGVEAYSGLGMFVWLGPGNQSKRARNFGRWSSIASLVLGMAGQVTYHLMSAQTQYWEITTVVACLPVVVFGSSMALLHMYTEGNTVE